MNFPLFITAKEFFTGIGLWIAIGLAGTVFLIVLVLFFVSLKKRKNEPVPHNENKVQSSAVLDAIGGRDNLVSRQHAGSRVALVLRDYSLINEKALQELGVTSFVKMSNKITLVIKDDALAFFKALD